MSKYRTKADGENSTKPYRPRIGIWIPEGGSADKWYLKLTPEVASELRRMATDGVDGALVLSPNRFKVRDDQPSHELTIFTKEERRVNTENKSSRPKQTEDVL